MWFRNYETDRDIDRKGDCTGEGADSATSRSAHETSRLSYLRLNSSMYLVLLPSIMRDARLRNIGGEDRKKY